MDRRAWIFGVASLGLARASIAGMDDLMKAIAAVKARAEESGLTLTRPESSRHYLGIGDAPPDYQNRALDLCEALASDFLSHFRKKGFDVNLPPDRMVVVTLRNPEEFAAFLGIPAAGAVGGVYDLDANRLVVFDNRARQAAGKMELANSISLFHEATHQLSYNTGLLDRGGDVPTCINEGLGVYGEVRRVKGPAKVGDPNKERLAVLAPLSRRNAPPWLPASRLLVEDGLFEGEREDQAYAQSWLLVYHLMKTPARLPQFRDYLKAIRPRRDDKNRLDDAKAAFGDLDSLDKDLKKAVAKLL